jgi:DNA-binding IclR family transcriptional regulator
MTQTIDHDHVPSIRFEEETDDRGSSLSSVAKALTLLEVIASGNEKSIGISDLATACDLPKSTTHRLLKALEARGFIGRSGSKYTVGYRFFQLGESAWSLEYEKLRRTSGPALEHLFARAGTTVHLAVLDEGAVVFLEKLTGRGGCSIPSRVGARVSANCTSLGKAIMAFSARQVIEPILETDLRRRTRYSVADPELLQAELDGVRLNGIAVDRQESRLGVFCVAAPILSCGQAVAAVSLSGLSDRIVGNEYANLVRETATRLSRALPLDLWRQTNLSSAQMPPKTVRLEPCSVISPPLKDPLRTSFQRLSVSVARPAPRQTYSSKS